jgi:23S rRNA (cytosine1962-C5)-methyltransferase
LRSGHPWLFGDSIRDQNRAGQLGELAVIYDRNNRFLAIGLFDPDSPIRVRILHAGKPQSIDDAWWSNRLAASLDLRAPLFDAQTTGYRCINGESDGWPGLVLDRYSGTLVLKLYTAAWFSRIKDLIRMFDSSIPNQRIVLRLSRNIQGLAAGEWELSDGTILSGAELAGGVEFLESGLKFEADVLRGQKTGFFLDQRENRRRVGALAMGREVLNAFSFSGGFSLYAARGGARSVTDLDISAHALAGAQRNFALNAPDPVIAGCRHQSIQADAFEWIANVSGPMFDLVILDPPSLAKRESERDGAIQAYGRLAAGGIARLRPGGILIAASCSAHVSVGEFIGTIHQSATRSGRDFEVLGETRHAPDHPASFKEGDYLKCAYLRLR